MRIPFNEDCLIDACAGGLRTFFNPSFLLFFSFHQTEWFKHRCFSNEYEAASSASLLKNRGFFLPLAVDPVDVSDKALLWLTRYHPRSSARFVLPVKKELLIYLLFNEPIENFITINAVAITLRAVPSKLTSSN